MEDFFVVVNQTAVNSKIKLHRITQNERRTHSEYVIRYEG